MVSWNSTKDTIWRMAVGGNDGLKTWKEHFEDLYNGDLEDRVTANMCSFNCIKIHNYFGWRASK